NYLCRKKVKFLELNLMRILYEYQEADKEAALITVISSENINNCSIGDMLLINAEGTLLAGNLDNDIIRKRAAQQGKICIDRGLSRKALINLPDGNAEIFVNSFCNEDRLIIAGAGTVSLNIYKLARTVGYKITILDNRPDMLTKERFPEAYELLLGDIAENLKLCSSSIKENTNIVIATHHHEFDEKSLQTVISSPARYIGVLGNSRRVAGYFKNLESLNISNELMNRVHSPIGLDIGGKRTAEIALSVMAEIQAVKYQRPGGFISKK
ncbi:MAG: XdhC family protein, partial [Clostridiaceae bacterium]